MGVGEGAKGVGGDRGGKGEEEFEDVDLGDSSVAVGGGGKGAGFFARISGRGK